MIAEGQQVWESMKARADELAEGGCLISMADAKYFVLELCRSANAETPSPESLEHLASELVRFTLEANETRTSRLRLRRA